MEVLEVPNSEAIKDGSILDSDEYQIRPQNKAGSSVDEQKEYPLKEAGNGEGMLTKMDEVFKEISSSNDHKSSESEVEKGENEIDQSKTVISQSDEGDNNTIPGQKWSKAMAHQRFLLNMNKKIQGLAVRMALQSLNL